MATLSLEWKCGKCRWAAVENHEEILARLRAISMATRDVPDVETLAELARVAAHKLRCPSCGGQGLNVGVPPEDDDEFWGDPLPCEACGVMIPAERLAVFPQSKLCAKCQAKQDRGEAIGETEYCPRCGAPMVMRAVRAGVTRYQLVCSLGTRCGR